VEAGYCRSGESVVTIGNGNTRPKNFGRNMDFLGIMGWAFAAIFAFLTWDAHRGWKVAQNGWEDTLKQWKKSDAEWQRILDDIYSNSH